VTEGQLGWQDLDGDLAGEHRLGGQVDDRHPAFANAPLDLELRRGVRPQQLLHLVQGGLREGGRGIGLAVGVGNQRTAVVAVLCGIGDRC